MQTIKEFIEETVQSNSKNLIVGDDSIATKVAINIALEAANMAGDSVARVMAQGKRMELACHMAGHLVQSRWSFEGGQSGKHSETLNYEVVCRIALNIVDTMFEVVAANTQNTASPDAKEAEAQTKSGS